MWTTTATKHIMHTLFMSSSLAIVFVIFCFFFRSDTKGVMVPPVLTDVNKDGVKDIVMSAFDGTMILFCGETLAIKWKVKFEDRESYR